MAKELGENLTDEELQVSPCLCEHALCLSEVMAHTHTQPQPHCTHCDLPTFPNTKEMIDEADKDGDGEVNEAEFLRIMKKTNLY